MKPQITLITLIIILGMGYGVQDAGYREETQIEIIKAPSITRINPYQEEYEQMLYPAVKISAGWSTGTGVAIDDYILTACHVVGDESEVKIESIDKGLTATVVITDTVKDLALLRPSQPLTYKAHLASADYKPYIFTPIWAVGCSLALKPRPSAGHITAINNDSWEVSSPILPGNSGGPVYAQSQRSPDNFGDAYEYEVIGIAVWVKVYDGQLITTMAGVVPIGEIHKFLEQVDKVISK